MATTVVEIPADRIFQPCEPGHVCSWTRVVPCTAPAEYAIALSRPMPSYPSRTLLCGAHMRRLVREVRRELEC